MDGYQYAHLQGVITFFSIVVQKEQFRNIYIYIAKRDKVRIVFFLGGSLLMLYVEVCA